MANTAKTELYAQWLSGNLVVADQAVSTGRRVFLDSTTGTDANGAGASPDNPVATLDYAITLCTANKGDIIYVMPGHAEAQVADAVISTVDIAGIRIVGIGVGADMPTLTLGHANATVSVTAPSVTIRNIRVASDVADAGIGITAGALADGLVVEDCELKDGDDAAKELAIGISIAAACDNCVIRDNRFLTVEGGTITSGIDLVGASENTQITDNYFYGDYGTAAIENGVAATKLLIADNKMKVADGQPGIELHTNTTGLICNNVVESTGISDPDAAIVADDCGWSENYVVVADGATAQLIGTAVESAQPIGTVFGVTKTVTNAAIVAGGAALTGASSGTLELVDCILQNGTTEIDSAGHAEVIELYSDNVSGSTSFMTIAASVLASEMRDLRDSTTGFKIVLESGKIISIKATTEDVTSSGTSDVYMIFRRLTAGATVAAA